MTESKSSKGWELTLTVASEDQLAELRAAWVEILEGRRARLNAAAEEVIEITERARVGLEKIAQAIECNPGTGQTGRLVRFVAGVYNGGDYPFDMTDLRALDEELASACVDYLNYDRLAKAEVHKHLPGADRQLQSWINRQGLRPRLRFNSRKEHSARLEALAQRSGREREAVFDELLEDYLYTHEAKIFGALQSKKPSPDGERPLRHARLLAKSQTPLCGASDGPWEDRTFDFSSLTCRDCEGLVLDPQPV